MSKKLNYIKHFFLFGLIILLSNKLYAENTKILFKINNKVYTSVDYENRIKYLDFIGDNNNVSEKIILDDYVSSILFFEFYKKINSKNDYSEKILQIYKNVENENKLNNKILNYKVNKENILNNLRLDLNRKTILEDIINSNENIIEVENDDIDLLYKFTLQYVNVISENTEELKNYFLNNNIRNIIEIKSYLQKNDIKFLYEEEEIIDLDTINEKLKEQILLNNSFFYNQSTTNQITFIYILKEFETYDGLIANLFSYITTKNKEIKKADCKFLIDNQKKENISNQEYEFSKLNNKLKEKLININDFVKFTNEEEFIYVYLCDIRYDRNLLNKYEFNKRLNSNVNILEKKFIKENSKRFNLQKYYE